MTEYAITVYMMLAACLLPIFWSWFAKHLGGFSLGDNAMPRATTSQYQGRAARALAVEQNSYESLPFFLAAVLVALYFVVPPIWINQLAIAYVGLRVTYGIAYLCHWPWLRSVLWLLSIACPVMLMLIAVKA